MAGWFDRRRICPLVLLAIGWGMAIGTGAEVVSAQPASSVQLPTFSYFSVGTSVLVPDRGGAVLGGLGRSASQIGQFGWPGAIEESPAFGGTGLLGGRTPGLGQRSFGASSSGQIAGISVWIHDFEAMEAQLLGQRHPAVAGKLPSDASNGHLFGQRQPVVAGPLSGDIFPKPPPLQATAGPGPSAADRPVLSVAELRQVRQAELEAQNEEAAMWLQRGEQAQAEGKPAVARIYYQMALRRAAGPLKQEIQQRLDALSAARSAVVREPSSSKR